jgi:hypothetical protein
LVDRKLEWEVNEAVNKRYLEEVKRLRQDLEQAGLDLESEEGRRRFREEVMKLNRSFFIVMPGE